MTGTVGFLGCCDTSSQPGWLKIAETDSLVWRLDIGNRGVGRAARLPESSGENPPPPRLVRGSDPRSLASSACGHISPVWGLVFPEPFLLLYGFSSSVSYKDTCHGFGVYSGNPGRSGHSILNLITSADLHLSINKVTSTGYMDLEISF